MCAIQNRRQAFSSPVGGLRKIREVIGNSLASKPMLLRSALPLACSAELSGKTLRNYLDMPPTHAPRIHSRERSSCHAPRISLCPPRAGCRILLPHLRSASRPIHRGGVHSADLCGHLVTHRNLLPVRRGTPAVPAPLSRRSCTAVIPLQQPSVNTVETPENSAHMFTDHTDAACPESGCCESSLTVFSIGKNQKIVNTTSEEKS